MEREIRGGEGGTAAERGFVRSTLFNSTTHSVSATISLLKLTVGHKPASIQIDEHMKSFHFLLMTRVRNQLDR